MHGKGRGGTDRYGGHRICGILTGETIQGILGRAFRDITGNMGMCRLHVPNNNRYQLWLSASAGTWKYDDDGEMSAPDIGYYSFRGCPHAAETCFKSQREDPASAWR